MTTTSLENEKNCVVLGGLKGASFVDSLNALRSELASLNTFVADLSDDLDVAPKPIVSIGYEVDRDAVLIDYLDKSLTGAVSRLIKLLAVARTARATLQQAGALASGSRR